MDLTASYSWNKIYSEQATHTLGDINLYSANELFGAPVNTLSIRSNLKIKDRSNLILSGLLQGCKGIYLTGMMILLSLSIE